MLFFGKQCISKPYPRQCQRRSQSFCNATVIKSVMPRSKGEKEPVSRTRCINILLLFCSSASEDFSSHLFFYMENLFIPFLRFVLVLFSPFRTSEGRFPNLELFTFDVCLFFCLFGFFFLVRYADNLSGDLPSDRCHRGKPRLCDETRRVVYTFFRFDDQYAICGVFKNWKYVNF